MSIVNHNERLEQRKKLLGVLSGSGTNKKTEMPKTLKATGERTNLTTQQLLQAYGPESIVVWRSFLVPTEILYATDAVPFTAESTCALIAQNQTAVTGIIERAEESHYDPKLCSFLKGIIGAMYQGFMPSPDLVVASPSFCSGIGTVLRDVAKYYGSPFFYLNLPLYSSALEDVEYVAKQLRSLVKLLCSIRGVSLSEVEEERLPGTIELSNQARHYWKQVEELRQAIPSPMSGREALDFATVLVQTWGSEKAVRIYQHLYSELQERVDKKIAAVPKEQIRLFWLHLRAYYSDKLMSLIEDGGGAVVFEGVNCPSREKMDPSEPYLSLAKEVLTNAGQYRTFSAKWEETLSYAIERFGIDGIIHFAHENCDWLKATFPGASDFFQKKKVPILTLSGDCLVRGRDELLSTRVQAFLESLRSRKSVPIKEKLSKSRKLLSVYNEHYFTGLDVGATTTKAVALSQGKLLGWGVFSTGFDNRSTAERAIREALRAANHEQEGYERLVATGVGRGNISSADEQVTEITCHTEGMRYFFPEVGTIIDIGGQDTKAILVKEMAFRMNDACAAGTGKFLEHIARTLDIGLEEMEKLDAFAEKPLAISRMCATFAESEVVNLIARGGAVEEIIRGIHEAVADRAIILLKQLSPEIISPVAMSGGVAMNRGVVRALGRRIGQKILVPDNPQIIGALGAAIIASQG